MPALQFSLATLNGLINGSQTDNSAKGTDSNGKKSGGDQFSSLLNVVGNVDDGAKNQSQSSKKDDAKDPVAADVPAPVSYRESTKKDNVKNISRVDDSKRTDDTKAPVTKTRSDDQDNAAPVERVSAKAMLRQNNNSNKTDKPKASDEVAASDDSRAVDNTKEAAAKNTDHVDDLAELVNIIAQLMAGVQNPQTPVVTANTDGVATGPATDIAALKQKLLDGINTLSDLKQTLAQLKGFLQATSEQGAPLTDTQQATLADINSQLKTEIDTIKNLFPNVGGDDKNDVFAQLLKTAQAAGVDTAMSAAQDMATVSDIGDVKSLLKSDIGLIKDALQKFRDDRAAATGIKTEIHATIQTQVTAPDSANNNIPVEPRYNNRGEQSVFSAAAIIAAADQNVNQQTANSQNAQAILPAASVAHAATSSDTDAHSGGNSGQGGSSTPQFTIGSVNAASTRSADNVASSQFSNLLNRTSQTPVTEQVAFQIKTAVGNGNSKISIQLHPEDLGKLDITLDVDAKGKTGVTITADNKQTLDMLQRDMQGLQKALNDAGLKADAGSLSFNLRGGDHQGQNQNQSQFASQYQKAQPDETQTETLNVVTVAAVTRSYTINLPDGLDIKI